MNGILLVLIEEKKLSINFSKPKKKFCLSLHYIGDNSYLFVSGIEIFEFKGGSKNVNFPGRLCVGSISDGFSAKESREISSGENVYDFSVNYNSIDKSDMLNIYKHLITNKSIKKH